MINLSYIGNKKGLMNYIGSKICEECLGDGIVYFMEQDKDGHYADTGIRTCVCQMSLWQDRTEE